MKWKIALAQIDSVIGDLKRNVERHIEVAEEALSRKAQLVLFPELSLTGYTVRDMNWDLALNPRSAQELRKLRELSKKITIVAGGIEEGKEFGIYNASFYFEDGEVKHVHRKVYPPTYGMFEEMRYFNRGNSVRAFDTKFGRLGMLICEDLWHLSLPYLLALDGATIILGLAASPTRVAGASEEFPGAVINSEHHRAFARLLSIWLAFVNRVGCEDGVNFWGGSELVAPDGGVVQAARLFDEDLVIADVDVGEVRRARYFSRHFLDEDIRLVQAELQRIKSRQDS